MLVMCTYKNMRACTHTPSQMYTDNATLLLKVVIPTPTKQKYFISDMPYLYLHQEVIVTNPECLCYGKLQMIGPYGYHFHYHVCWLDRVSLLAAQNFCLLNVYYDSPTPLSQWIIFYFCLLRSHVNLVVWTRSSYRSFFLCIVQCIF